MSTETREGFYSHPAAADLSAKQYFLVTVNSAKKVALQTTAGARVSGILKNEPKANEEARYEFHPGVHKVAAGGTFDAGDELTVDGAGKAIKAVTAGHHIFGQAESAGAAGVIAMVRWGYRGVVPA